MIRCAWVPENGPGEGSANTRPFPKPLAVWHEIKREAFWLGCKMKPQVRLRIGRTVSKPVDHDDLTSALYGSGETHSLKLQVPSASQESTLELTDVGSTETARST